MSRKTYFFDKALTQCVEWKEGEVGLNRKISVIEDLEGKKTVFIHDIRFKGKRAINWKEVEKNRKEKHDKDARYGWYSYESRFALPVFGENEEIERYNVFHVALLVRHDQNGRKYLYDIMKIKKETSNLFQPKDLTQ